MLHNIEPFIIALAIIVVLFAIVGFIYKRGIIVSKEEILGKAFIEAAKNDALIGCFVIVLYIIFRYIKK